MDSSQRVNRLAVKYVLAVSLVHLGLLVHGIFIHGPGWDEVGHLPAGLSHWRTGRFDLYRVNPPLPRMFCTVPLVFFDEKVKWQWDPSYTFHRPEWDMGKEMIEANGRGYFLFLRVARLMCLPFAVLAIRVIWLWSLELFGPQGAMMSVTAWCFSPIVITNAQMMTPDTAAAACGGLACFVFRRWLFEGTMRWAFTAGLALGLAELTKFTWLILFAVWPMQWIIHRWVLPNKRHWGVDIGHLLVVFSTCLFAINAGYGFEGTFRQLGDYRFFSNALGGQRDADTNSWMEGNRFSGTALASVPVPLPENMVQGVDRQKLDFEYGFTSYLRGEWRTQGWWYYYLYGLVVKEPLGFLLLACCALATALRLKRDARGIAEAACLGFPGLALFVFVSSQTGFNHHLRYILPSLVFLSIFVGVCGTTSLSRSFAPIAGWGLVAIGAASSLLAAPHSHSYFNELVGGPKNGPLHLLDSNVDWGQDILLLEEWARKHPEKPLDGVVHSLPVWLGVRELTTLPRADVPVYFPGTARSEVSIGPTPGRFAISVRYLYQEGSGYEYFRRFRPVSQVGHTIYIYELSSDDVEGLKLDSRVEVNR